MPCFSYPVNVVAEKDNIQKIVFPVGDEFVIEWENGEKTVYDYKATRWCSHTDSPDTTIHEQDGKLICSVCGDEIAAVIQGFVLCMKQRSMEGASQKGELTTTFESLVKVFGKPNAEADDVTDFKWKGTINGKPFEIYNYKDGPAYGFEPIPEDADWEWYVNGFSGEVANQLTEFFTRAIATFDQLEKEATL